MLNNSIYLMPQIFPTPSTESENMVICVSGVGSNKPFHSLISNFIPCLDALEKTQCFPLYTYTDNTRTDNITDWTLTHFQTHYTDTKITKIDIFHYIYGILHKPNYRTKYALNLKKELPRIPLTDDFGRVCEIGRSLAPLHLSYETCEPYSLELIENPNVPFSMTVDKMKFSKDKTQIIYNDFITLKGIPPEVFEYKLGKRSALEWIVDQYKVKRDTRSGIVNDPNKAHDKGYILDLIKKMVTVSLETVRLVKKLV